MKKLSNYMKEIREPDTSAALYVKILISAAILIGGLLLGVLQKKLDSTAFNELPVLFQKLDITNFFGRLAVWIFLATVISVYAKTPLRAALNTFLFFIGMVSGYYIYCSAVLGFFPGSYALIWVVISFLSPVPAYVCWYAKGKGRAAVVISAGITGVLFSQAFLITQGFYMTHLTEALIWAAALIVLRRKPKEFAVMIGLSLVVALVYQLFIPYWG